MTDTTLETLAGQVIIAGFEGTALPDDIVTALSRRALGGIILFKRNIVDYRQTAELLHAAHRAWGGDSPPIVGVDQEGGRVVRLREPLTVLPPAARFGEHNRPTLTALAGELLGKELRAVGFTVNFAPVLDVNTNPDSPVIGDRAFGTDTKGVIRHGLAFGRGLVKGGVIPCAKHFPGHGDAALDSHVDLPTVHHNKQRLTDTEMAPFAAWAEENMGPVMSAHVRYPNLDADHPATLSRAIIHGLLRKDLGFTGVVFSDDMEMGAIEALGGAGNVAVQAMEAGIDGLLVCRRQDRREAVQGALARRAADDSAFKQRLETAANRLRALPITKSGPDLTWLGSNDHLALQTQVLQALKGKTN